MVLQMCCKLRWHITRVSYFLWCWLCKFYMCIITVCDIFILKNPSIFLCQMCIWLHKASQLFYILMCVWLHKVSQLFYMIMCFIILCATNVCTWLEPNSQVHFYIVIFAKAKNITPKCEFLKSRYQSSSCELPFISFIFNQICRSSIWKLLK